jgi:dual specificity protein kinase YAK1
VLDLVSTLYFSQYEEANKSQLNKQMDKNDDHHLLRLKDTFIHRQHLCLVFELLSVNLYELIKQNQFRGLSTTLVRVFAQQLINGLALLGKAKLIHCDLKPENILLKKYVAHLRMLNV